jgi:hypothetical protein
MRLILVGMICTTFIGGMFFFMEGRRPVVSASRAAGVQERVIQSYAIEITSTFPVEPDPFAVRTDDGAQGLIVRLGDQIILQRTEGMTPGFPLRVDPLNGLTRGRNEIFFEASPSLEDSGKSQAVRIQIYQGENPVADKTFWSEYGAKVSGILDFTVEEKMEADHDHH